MQKYVYTDVSIQYSRVRDMKGRAEKKKKRL